MLLFCVNTVCLCLFVPLPKHYFWHAYSKFVSNTATISYSIKNLKKMISTCDMCWHIMEITVWNYYCFDRHRIYNSFVLVQIIRTQSEAFIINTISTKIFCNVVFWQQGALINFCTVVIETHCCIVMQIFLITSNTVATTWKVLIALNVLVKLNNLLTGEYVHDFYYKAF